MRFDHLALEVRGPVLHVILNRPERLNALSGKTLEEVGHCFESLAGRFDVRVAVLRGAGRAFSSGADRENPPGIPSGDSGAEPISARERRYALQVGWRACRAIQHCEVITVACVRGYAIGGGLALALACDLRIAARETVFHIPEVDLGTPLSWGATARLISEIGAARAREMILLCDRVDGERACHWGLVHRAVPERELDAECDILAKRLAAKPELAVHMTKSQFRAYAQTAGLGNVSEMDGDLSAGVRNDPTFQNAFGIDPD